MKNCVPFQISVFLLMASAMLPAAGMAGMTVWSPDTTVCCGTPYPMSVLITGITPEDSVLAYQFDLEFDSTLIHFTEAKHAGMTDSWGDPVFNQEGNILHMAGFTADTYLSPGDTNRAVLANVMFDVIADTTDTTFMQFSDFRFFNRHGEVPVDSLAENRVTIVLNFPPVIVEFDQFSIYEDDTLTIYWNQVIQDVNNSADELDIQFTLDPPYQYIVDPDENWLKIIPPANWSGAGFITLRVIDPFDESYMDMALIATHAVADPPGSFHLSSPPYDTLITDFNSFHGFSWQAAENVDEGDIIQYRFYLGPDSLFRSSETILVSGITETSLLFSQSLENKLYYWAVQASDQDGFEVLCDQTFRFRVSGQGNVDAVSFPESFYLYPNYPNPFNPGTVLQYDVPVTADVSLNILNGKGQLVKRLCSGIRSPGRYLTVWHGDNEAGQLTGSGIYYVIFKAGDYHKTRKVILMR